MAFRKKLKYKRRRSYSSRLGTYLRRFKEVAENPAPGERYAFDRTNPKNITKSQFNSITGV